MGRSTPRLTIMTLLLIVTIGLLPLDQALSAPPTPGTVLYQVNWSSRMNGWAGPPNWKVLNGMLLNDGTNQSTIQSILAPYQPPAPDYAAETEIQVLKREVGSGGGFGLKVRNAEPERAYIAGVGVNKVSRHLRAVLRLGC